MFEKISVSISDHSSRDLLSCVDNAMILSEGKIVAKGTPQELLKNTRAIEAYFGEGFKNLNYSEKSSQNRSKHQAIQKKYFCFE